ncbi:MAG: phosphodiester glycosidase family protein [Clostridia bacterium]|nr:phosphodiester glycosidase family protein [Clostridia bacterium]
MDVDLVTNVILNNDYKLHENQEGIEPNPEDIENYKSKNKFRKKRKKKEKIKKSLTKKQKILRFLKRLLITIIVFVILAVTGIFLFFKTTLFQKYKELWVLTAMSTMNHQYLATWFLSEEEINEILSRLQVENNENSELHEVTVEAKKENEITVEKISGKNYVGFVMTVSDPTKVKFVDSRKKSMGTKLSGIVKENNAIAGINAGGFEDPDGKGMGNILNTPVIINRELLYGSKNNVMSLIGLSAEGELILGKYNYQEAIEHGIESAVDFGPFIIVNGKNQIQNSNAGGLHPRMCIGQKKDGTFVFVCIDGRQPGYSLGATLLEVQNIFNRYDVYNAANLDGGSSATMYYDGKVVNKTSTPAGERYLPNAIIVTK